MIDKESLEEFNQSYPKLRNHFDVLFKAIRWYYVDKRKLPDGKNKYRDSIIFPQEKDEWPESKFKEYFALLDKKDEDFLQNQNQFQSSVVLYFESFADFKQDLDQITELLDKQKIELQELLFSTSKEEFINHCINFQENDTKLVQKFNFIRIMIVYEKIYNTEKGLSESFFKVTKGFETDPDFVKD